MTRKSKARFGMTRTYKLNPAVKALRAALFAGVALAAVAPSAQAACVVVGNSVTCTGFFDRTVNNGDEWTVVTPADLASILFDSNSDISVFNSQFGVNASNAGSISAINDGHITVYNQLGAAVGFAISSPNGDVEAENNGFINAISTVSFARGILASSTNGDITASNTGSIYASGATNSFGVFATTTNGNITAYNSGDVTAYAGNSTANGFRLVTTNGNIDFTSNGGSITAQSDFFQAIGINAVTSNGNVTINNSSDILADSGASGSTYGIFARASTSGDVSVINDSYIHAIAVNGGSTGIISISNNFSAYVGGSGDVTAESINGAAIGVRALAFNNGYADIVVSGDITASSVTRNATGILANGGAGVYINSSGAISSTTTTGTAIGIQADSPKDIDIFNYGDILAQTTTGFARGIQAQATGFLAEVSVENSGDITATSFAGGSAQGIRAIASRGYTSVTNTGTISASSTNSNALSIVAVGQYGVDVINSGDLSADTGALAYGIYANTRFYDAYVKNTGDISTHSTFASTSGIYAKGGNYAVIVNEGDITVLADNSVGYGAYAYALNYDAIIDNSGAISVTALGDSTGLFAKSIEGDAYIYNTGEVSISSQNGISYGVYASAFQSSAYITNYGDVSASSQFSDASAIVAVANNVVAVTNTGVLTATSGYGDAIGIVVASNNGLAYVENSGEISASSYAGNAYGIYADSDFGNVAVYNDAQMTVTSTYGSAYGIFAQANYGGAKVINSGVLNVSGDDFAAGIFVFAQDGDYASDGNAVVVNSGDISSTATSGEALGIVAIASDTSYVKNSAVIDASSFGYEVYGGNNAYGIIAAGNYGASVINTGAINAYSEFGDASGMDVFGNAYAVVSNTAAITANANGSAKGINVFSAGYTGIVNSGTITATSVDGQADGILAESFYGNTVVNNSGELIVNGYTGAFGISADSILNGNVSVTNSGVITASTDYGTATGIYASSKYGAITVSNTANMLVTSAYGSTGIETNTEGSGLTTIINSGDFVVNSRSYAAGINVYSYGGDIVITNTGDLRATGNYNARGIRASTNEYDSDITISNNLNTIVATSGIYGSAYGIYAYSDGSGDIYITSSGIITASGGDAYGIYAATDNDTLYSEYGAAGGSINITLGSTSNISATATNMGGYSEYGINSGGNAYGVYARVEEATGNVSVTNAGRIVATANGINATAAGIQATDEQDGRVSVTTTSSSVISATANGLDGYAYGINAIAEYGDVLITNAGSITAGASGSGGFSAGIRAESAFGTSISNSGTIGGTGSNPWAIVSYSEGNTVITNSATGVINGAIYTTGGNDSLTNSGRWNVGNANSSYFEGGNDTITNNVGARIFMDNSAIYMGSGTNAFLNNGRLFANNDNVINMGNLASVFTNNGSSIHMNDGVANDSLTIIGSFAGTGRIYVDANGTSMLADRLYIEGNVVTNTANVIDVYLSGVPSLADIVDGEEIDIVSVSGVSSAANFSFGVVTLNDNELFALSAQLNKAINYSGTNDLFSLGFTIDGLSDSGIAISSVAPGVQSLWHMGNGTLFQREGSHREYKEIGNGGFVADYKGGVGAWFRGFTSGGGLSPDSSNNNFGANDNHGFDFDGSGIEFGLGYAFNNQWSAGILGGTSDSTLKPDNGGRIKIDADTLGGYVTYTPGNGFYADLSYRAMDFDGYGNGGADEFNIKGNADGFSLELGYGYKTASGLVIEPQFQYSMVDVDLDSIAYNSYDYELTDGDSTEMRVGVALRKSYKTAGGNYWTPYGALSYLNESDGSNTYQIGGLLDGTVDTSGGSTLLEAGATGLIGKFGISGGLNWRDGGAYESVVGGQLSVRYDW